MDPFGAEGELVNIHTAFIQGQYRSVVHDFSLAEFSPDNTLAVQILQYRAACAVDDHTSALAISESDAKRSPDLAAMKIYAAYLHGASANLEEQAEKLAQSSGDNLSVQLLSGTVLARAGKQEAALQLLSQHQGSLDAVALMVQIHLSQNRTDLAAKEAKSARSFAQDALLVNLAESWISMRQGGQDAYQKAFYVFEELAQGPSSASATSLVAQAVSELHMGRVEEAETALNQALELEPRNSAALVNKLVLDTGAGKETEEIRKKLQSVDAKHELLRDLAAKKEAFQAAMGKYNPKFEP